MAHGILGFWTAWGGRCWHGLAIGGVSLWPTHNKSYFPDYRGGGRDIIINRILRLVLYEVNCFMGGVGEGFNAWTGVAPSRWESCFGGNTI